MNSYVLHLMAKFVSVFFQIILLLAFLICNCIKENKDNSSSRNGLIWWVFHLSDIGSFFLYFLLALKIDIPPDIA